jgi:uncharacterized cupredoxin-like copper-binding protein
MEIILVQARYLCKPLLDPGESGVLTLRFQKFGTYEMYCPINGHRLAGMKGSVMVK